MNTPQTRHPERPSAKIRLTATLAHAIGGLRLEIDDGSPDSGEAIPRFSPCQLRHAVGEAMDGERSVETEDPLVKLVRSKTLAIKIHEGRSRVYPGDIIAAICCTTAVFAFATTLSAAQVRNGSNGGPRMYRLRTKTDELLQTTIVYIEVDLHHRLEPGWQDMAVNELQEAMIGCMRADVDRRNVGSRISN